MSDISDTGSLVASRLNRNRLLLELKSKLVYGGVEAEG